MLKLTSYDYDYLKGEWQGAFGAAFWMVDEFCGENGLGDYGKPTEKGERLIEEYETRQDEP